MLLSVTAKTLNSSPMPVGPRSVSRARAFSISAAWAGVGPRLQGGGAGLDPERCEEIALQDDAVGSRPAGNGGLGEAMEIHMGGQIASPGSARGSTKACRFSACRVSPWAGPQ